jgi:hypothetical protein
MQHIRGEDKKVISILSVNLNEKDRVAELGLDRRMVPRLGFQIVTVTPVKTAILNIQTGLK